MLEVHHIAPARRTDVTLPALFPGLDDEGLTALAAALAEGADPAHFLAGALQLQARGFRHIADVGRPLRALEQVCVEGAH